MKKADLNCRILKKEETGVVLLFLKLLWVTLCDLATCRL